MIEPTWLLCWFIVLSLGSFVIIGSAFVYARFVTHLPAGLDGYYDPLYGNEMAFWRLTILPCAPPMFGIARTVFTSQKRYATRASAVLIGMFFALFFGSGMVITLSAAMVALNGALDRSAAQTLTFRVAGKRSSEGKEPQYFLQARDPRPPFARAELRVAKRAWKTAKVGDGWRVTLHKGAFGVEWIERVQEESPSRAR